MRKLYWYLSAYIKKHGLIMGASVLGALILFSFSISTIAQRLEFKPRRYVGVVGEYSLQNLPLTIQNQLSGGLTKVEPDNTVSPYLAERWSIEDGGKTYRFVLRDDIAWQDGQTLEPADLNYQFNDVEVITTPNDIVFKLPNEYVPFPTVVSKPVFRTVTQKHLIFFKRPMLIGLGNYAIEDYKESGQKLKEITIDSPQEKLIYRFYLTEDEAVMAFKRGEIDVLNNLSTTYGLDQWETVRVDATLNYDRYLAVFFNNASPLFNKNVRQALSYALEKDQSSARAYSPINPNSWAYLEGGKSYDYDLERAKERLLAEIPPEPLHFELTTTNNFAAEAESIAQQWEKFGQQAYEACLISDDVADQEQCINTTIEVSVRITNFPDTSNFQVLLLGQEIPQDPDQYHLWHSEQSTNFINYKNTRIDALLEKGRTTAEKTERLAIYQEFQQFFLEDAPVIFLRHLESYQLTRL